MRVLNLRRTGAGSVVARFDLSVNEDLTIFDLVLKRNSAGHYRVYPPTARSRGLASMSPAFVAAITDSAVAELDGERSAAA